MANQWETLIFGKPESQLTKTEISFFQQKRIDDVYDKLELICREKNIIVPFNDKTDDVFLNWFEDCCYDCHCKHCYSDERLKLGIEKLLEGYTSCIRCGHYNIPIINYNHIDKLKIEQFQFEKLCKDCKLCK